MKLLLAEDDADFQMLLRAIMATDPSITLVGAASDADEAISIAKKYQPDVALLDVNMPGGGGTHAANRIRLVSPHSKILALSGSREREAVIRMLRAGAIGYLIKGATPREILQAIADAAAGTPTLATEAAQELIGDLRKEFDRDAVDARERSLDTAQIECFIGGEGVELVAQPIFDLRTDAAIGYEALARFNSKQHRRPDAWLARAGELNLRVELEIALAKRALSLLPVIPEESFLSINVSPDVIVEHRELLGITSRDAPRIVIELTEHAAVGDYEQLNASLRDLRAAGTRIAVDDAGAGFASLQHILQLTPEFIKLDITLTRHIDHDSPRRALAASLISFASHISATMVAEGIESRDELKALRQLGVHCGQGFYLARPRSVERWMRPTAQSNRLSSLLRSATATARRGRNAPEVVRSLAKTISAEFPLWRVSLRRLMSQDQLRVEALWSKAKTKLKPGMTMSVVATAFPEVLRTDRPVTSTDLAIDSFVEQLLREEGVSSWISLPVHDIMGGLVGLLTFSSNEPEAFDESSVSFFTQLGHAVESPLAAFLT